MNFIDGNMKAVSSKTGSCVDRRIFDFSVKDEDYYLNYHVTWEQITSHYYAISLRGKIFSIPSGMFVLCSCDDGNTDWIVIDELIGRDIGIFTMAPSLKTWSLDSPRLVDYQEATGFFPSSKTPVPVIDTTEQKIIVVSTIDQQNKMKDKHFSVFLV